MISDAWQVPALHRSKGILPFLAVQRTISLYSINRTPGYEETDILPKYLSIKLSTAEQISRTILSASAKAFRHYRQKRTFYCNPQQKVLLFYCYSSPVLALTSSIASFPVMNSISIAVTPH